jgi:two-component system cell cycle sensor histidine kinase/response regulator CckA
LDQPTEPTLPILTILLVEDDSMVRRWETTVLQRAGFRILEAADGDEAIEILSAEPHNSPDLVITDLELPKISGAELALKLAELRPSTRILFTSGYPDDALPEVIKALKTRFAFFRKPFSPPHFLEMVRSLLA